MMMWHNESCKNAKKTDLIEVSLCLLRRTSAATAFTLTAAAFAFTATTFTAAFARLRGLLYLRLKLFLHNGF
ncbi:hypothetical protein D3C76_1867340 [compost metagenome]